MTKKALFILLLLVFNNIFSQDFSLQATDTTADFYHLVTNNGIAQNSISYIAQDSIGQMWFATKNGVIRYNGKQKFIYQFNPDKKNTINDNFTNFIHISENGDLWLATNKGINKYNYKNDEFEPFLDSITANSQINSIREDKEHKIWFVDGTYNKIIVYNPKTKKIKSYQYSGKQNTKLLVMYITSTNRIFITTNRSYLLEFNEKSKTFTKIELFHKEDLQKYHRIKAYFDRMTEDHEKNLWVATNFGFFIIIDLQTMQTKRFYFKKDLSPRGHYYLMSVIEDSENNIWFGTWFDGLYKLTADRKKLFHFMPDRNNPNSLSNNIVESIFQDNAGYIWVGTEFAGINILKKNKKFFVRATNIEGYEKLPPLPYLCSANAGDTIFLGVDGGGLLWFNMNKAKEIHKTNLSPVDAIRIFSLLYDKKRNTLWIGSGKGLIQYNLQNKKIQLHKYERDNYNSMSGNNIISLCLDENGNIWAGTIFRGLTKFNPEKNKFYRFMYDKNNPEVGISNNYISSLICDNGNIWAGTLDGLNKINTKTGVISRFFKTKENSISCNKINTLFKTGNKIWIGTEGGGLNFYDCDNHTFTYFSKKDGLPSNNVKGINTDSKNNLWLSTTQNIVKFNLKSKEFVVYDKSDGLQNEIYIRDYGLQKLEFFENFANKLKYGNLIFGGIAGFFVFNPDNLPVNNFKAPVIIDNLLINGKKYYLDTNSITLEPDQNHLEISLTVLNFIQPEKNKYAYFLENYDTTWHYGNDIAQYFNLPSGKYIFHYKGANNDGIWNKNTKSLKIEILPRFYKTAWFLWLNILFVLILISAFILYRRYIHIQLQKKKEQLKYVNSNLSKKIIEKINNDMNHILETKQLFLEPDLSLQKLAQEINTKPNYLSQTINTIHNCNFREYINTYRINYAKKMLINTALKIEAVAYESGFNTISTFNIAFKKETGLTPSQFRKKHNNGSSV